MTPEHTKRINKHDYYAPIHPDVSAAFRYVESVKHTSDYTGDLAWHGWALREAFLAGISYATATERDRPAPPKTHEE